MFQAHFLGNVLKFSATLILKQNALLAARRISPALKCVDATQVKAAATFIVRSIDADVGKEQIHQSIVVEIEKHRAGGMSGRASSEAGFRCDVFEFSPAEIPEQEIPHSDGGDEQVRQTVVVDVSKRS